MDQPRGCCPPSTAGVWHVAWQYGSSNMRKVVQHRGASIHTRCLFDHTDPDPERIACLPPRMVRILLAYSTSCVLVCIRAWCGAPSIAPDHPTHQHRPPSPNTDLQLAKQEFARKEQIVRDQVQRLRDTANERMTRLVDEVVASTSGKGRGGTSTSTASITQDLRNRINDAIDIMQRGLVERDTEV